jgi:hypothetical protein
MDDCNFEIPKEIHLKFSEYFFCEILKPNNHINKKKALAKQVQSLCFWKNNLKAPYLDNTFRHMSSNCTTIPKLFYFPL